MKKILKLSLVLVIIYTMMMLESVYAVTGNINITPTKTTIEEEKEVTVTISLSDIKSDVGVNTFGGTLKYDKEKLTLVKFEGQNGWSTPKEDGINSTYFSKSGKFIMDAESQAKSDGPILKITFKANEKITGDTTVSIENLMLADGMTTPVKVEQIKTNITIKKNVIDITPEEPDNKPTTPEEPDNKPTTPEEPDNKPTTPEEPDNKPTTPEEPDNKPTTPEEPDNKPTTPEEPDNKPTTPEKPDDKTENSDKDNTNAENNTNKIDNTIKKGELPQTGENITALIIILGLLILLVIVLSIRIINVNKKVKRH